LKVLITGSRGYIGSTLAKKLVINHDVVPLGVDKEIRPEGSTIYGLFYHSEFEDYKLIDVILRSQIDTICHLAADASVPESVVSPDKFYYNNVLATIKFLNNLIAAGWRGNFIFSSSAAVYPSSSYPVTEEDRPDPPNPYGHTKLMGEQIIKDYCSAYDINAVCFRYFNVAGAWNDVGDHGSSEHVLQKLVKSFNNDSVFTIYGNNKNTPDGTCVRDYIHVRDVCEAHVAAIAFLKNNPGFHVFNLGTGQGTSVMQLVQGFTEYIGKEIKYAIGQSRDGDPDFLVADGNKFIEKTGYTYKYSDLKNIIITGYEYGKAKHNKHLAV